MVWVVGIVDGIVGAFFADYFLDSISRQALFELAST